MADVGKILIMPRGDYDPTETYYILDVVRFNYMTFMARVNNLTNVAPPSTPTSNANWMFLVADGGGATTLGSLTDVDTTSVQDGQTIIYNATDDEWQAGDSAGRLSELKDVDPTTTTTPTTNQILKYNGTKWAASFGGSGHTMSPDPDPDLTDEEIAETISLADGTNDEVASLYGIQRWSNSKTVRVVVTQGIGHYGIGEWQDSITVESATAAQEAQWGWIYHDIFKKLDPDWGEQNGYDVDIKFGFDPKTKEPITLGGYWVDTDTGYLCVKFANYVVNTTDAKVTIDVTFTRNDVVTIPPTP